MDKPLRTLCVVAALAAASAPAAAYQVLGKRAIAPGDTGSLEYTIRNAATNDKAFTAAGVKPQLGPGILALDSSDLGPQDIPVGATHTFRLDYLVTANAPHGPAVIGLAPTFKPDNPSPSFPAAAGLVPILIDDADPKLFLGTIGFSRPPSLGSRNGLYFIFGTATDDAWLGNITLSRVGVGPSVVVATIPASSPTFNLGQKSNDFLFTGLPAGVYDVTARDVTGRQSHNVRVDFQEFLSRADLLSYDCRSNVVPHKDGLGPRQNGVASIDPNQPPVPVFQQVGAVSALIPVKVPAEASLATLIEGVEAEVSTFTSERYPIFWNMSSVLGGVVGRGEAPRNTYLDIGGVPPYSLIPIDIGALLLGGRPRLRLELQGGVGSTSIVRRMRAYTSQYSARVLAAGDSTSPFGSATVPPEQDIVALHPNGRNIYIRFPPAQVRPAPLVVQTSVEALNPDPLCGFNSTSPHGSTVATSIELDPDSAIQTEVTLPLEPGLSDADKLATQVRVQTAAGPEAFPISVDLASNTATMLTDARGLFELLIATGPDRAAPVTALAFSTGAPRDTGGLPVFGPNGHLPFLASDPGAAASGVLQTEYKVGSGVYVDSSTPLGLGTGVYDTRYRSWDAVNNLEPTRRQTIHVDADAPTITQISPSSGAFTQGTSSITVSWDIRDTLDPAPTAQALLVQVSTSGVPIAGSTPIPVSQGQVIPASQLPPANYVTFVDGVDWVQNVSTAASGIFTT